MQRFNWKSHVASLGSAAAAAAAAILVACGGGGGSSAAAPGTLRLAMTDAPACGYDHVYVTVDRVRVHQSGSAADADGGWSEVVLPTPKRMDLLTLTNGVLEELGQTSLPAGTYSQVRLVLVENGGNNQLANAVQPTGGALVALNTPSAQQSGLKLKTNFTVVSGQTADLMLDFDACRSVVVAGGSGSYNLKPVLSVTPRTATGVQGYVATSLAASSTLVTAQQTGVVVRSAVPDSTGKFVLPSLSAGSYDIVVTADGHSTGIVSGVPITATSSVTLNGTTTAIVTPAATMRTAGGTTAAATNGSTTTAVTDATVRATQALTGGPTVEVARLPVNAATGAWQLRVPAEAPVKAAYASGAALSFGADTAAAGRYRVEASATGRTTVGTTTDVSAADQTVPLTFAP